MQLFQTIRRGFAFLGVSSLQSMQTNPFNRRNVATLFSFILTIAAYNIYLFRVASTFWEYTINIYSNSATFLAVGCYVIVILKMRKIFQVIDKCEKVTVDCKRKLELCITFQQVSIQSKIERIKKFEKCFRSWTPKIGGNLRRCQWTYRTNQWNCLCFIGNSGTRFYRVSEVLRLSFQLFHHGFGKRGSRTANSNVVRKLFDGFSSILL